MTRATHSEYPIAGRLEGTDVPALIRELHRRNETGQLHIYRDGVHRTIFIESGRVAFASSSDPNDRLGEHLLRQGKITLNQLEAALAQQDSEKRLGTRMMEAGVLSAGELVEAVVDQIRSIVVDLLTWTDGVYRFEHTEPAGEVILLDLSTEELIFQGVREIHSLSLIERSVGPPRTVFRMSDDWGKRAEPLDLSEGARALLDRLAEKPASVDTLCREVCVSNFEIYQTLWAFKLLGVAEPCERPNGTDHGGSLKNTNLAEVMIRLESMAATGVLYLSRGPVERSLLFAAGRCVFATSKDPDDGLVNFLFRRGVISLRDKEETIRRLLSNKRVGTILRELGAIDNEDLQAMVRQQVGEIIYDTFGWEDGDFVFVPDSLPHAEEITLDCGVGSLISEGVRRVRSWTRLLRGCGGIDNPLCLTPRYLEILDAIEAGVAEWEVVNVLKSPQTPRRVCGLTESDDYRVCQILWTLKLLGAIEDSPVDIEAVSFTDETAPVTETVQVPPEVPAEPAEAADASGAGDEVAGTPVEIELAAPGVAQEAGELGEAPFSDAALAPAEAESPAVDHAPRKAQSEGDTVWSAGDETSLAHSEAPVGDPHWAEVGEIEQTTHSLGEGAEEPPLEPTAAIDQPLAELSLSEIDKEWSEEASLADADRAEDQVHEPELDLPDGVEDTIVRFNAMHRVVYRAVRSEIGAGASNFVRSCCEQVARVAPDPVEGVELFADGSWDVAGLKKVIAAKQIEDPWEIYQRVLDEEFVSLQPHLGDVRAERLKQKIWEIEQDSSPPA
jgi:hypothetical protein